MLLMLQRPARAAGRRSHARWLLLPHKSRPSLSLGRLVKPVLALAQMLMVKTLSQVSCCFPVHMSAQRAEEPRIEPESETEPELRASTSSNEAKRKIPPTEASSPPKKRRVSPGADDTSVTEPESEPENEVPPITQTTVAGTTAPDAEDSVTEPESESDPERPVNPVKAEEDSETEPESEIDEEDEEVDNRKKVRTSHPDISLRICGYYLYGKRELTNILIGSPSTPCLSSQAVPKASRTSCPLNIPHAHSRVTRHL